MKLLNFLFEHKQYPYSDENQIFGMIWGRIILKFDDLILLDWEWDIAYIKEWFYSKKGILDSDIFDYPITHSIAEWIDILFSKDAFNSDTEEMDYYDKISELSARYYFKIEGTPTQDFFIGKRDLKTGEISFKRDNKYYQFLFDMEKFIRSTEERINIIS